jgi:replicative DNA helicase
MRKEHIKILSEGLAFADTIGKIKTKIQPIEDTLIAYMFWNLTKKKVTDVVQFLPVSALTSEFAVSVFTAMYKALSENTDPSVYLVKKDVQALSKLQNIHYNRNFINIDDQINHILETKKVIDATYLMQRVIQNEIPLSEMTNTVMGWKSSSVEKTNEELASEFFNKVESISTGYPSLDEITGGIGRGHLWMISGYTSVGKTMFLVSILHNLISNGNNCVFFSLEMTNKDIFGRIVAKDSGVNIRNVIKDPNHRDAEKVRESIARVKYMPFKIFQNKRGLDDITLEISKLQSSEGNIDCVFIDYAQLISTPLRTSEYDSMTRVAQKLQDFCKTTNIPIIILSQISNESAKSPDDKMISAKGGGSLPASADVAMEIFSDMTADEISQCNAENKPYQATVRIKKNRHGRTGKVKMDSFAYRSCFEESVEQFDTIRDMGEAEGKTTNNGW